MKIKQALCVLALTAVSAVTGCARMDKYSVEEWNNHKTQADYVFEDYSGLFSGWRETLVVKDNTTELGIGCRLAMSTQEMEAAGFPKPRTIRFLYDGTSCKESQIPKELSDAVVDFYNSVSNDKKDGQEIEKTAFAVTCRAAIGDTISPHTKGIRFSKDPNDPLKNSLYNAKIVYCQPAYVDMSSGYSEDYKIDLIEDVNAINRYILNLENKLLKKPRELYRKK